MSGYGAPTNDPWQAIKQRQAREREAAQEANRPGRTQTFQSVRKLWNAILELKQIVSELATVVAAIPISNVAEIVGNSFSPTESWATVASLTIPRPEGKSQAAVMAQAGIALNWSATGGAAWPAVSSRVVINGEAGPAMPLSQGVSDAGSGGVSGRMAGASNRARTVAGDTEIIVQLQVAITGWLGDGTHSVSFNNGVPQLAASATFSP